MALAATDVMPIRAMAPEATAPRAERGGAVLVGPARKPVADAAGAGRSAGAAVEKAAPLTADRPAAAALLPALPGGDGAAVLVRPAGDARADRLLAALRPLPARAAALSGIEPFVAVARLNPGLARAIALPVLALLAMVLVLGGPAALAVGIYFVGCGMILARPAVKTLLERAASAPPRQTG